MLMAMSNNDPFHYLNASQQPSRSLWQYSFALQDRYRRTTKTLYSEFLSLKYI